MVNRRVNEPGRRPAARSGQGHASRPAGLSHRLRHRRLAERAGPLRLARDRFGPQTYRVGAEETVETPAGPQRALRVERVRNKSGRVTTTWLGMDNGFVPVRVVQREADGESFEMRLVSLKR